MAADMGTVPGDPEAVEPLDSTSWRKRCIIVKLFPLNRHVRFRAAGTFENRASPNFSENSLKSSLKLLKTIT